MSDFAEGWIIWGAQRSAILEALAAERQRAFVTRKSRPVVVFARSERDAALRVSARLASATLVTFSVGDDWGEVRLVAGGLLARWVKTSGTIATAAQRTEASELVRAVARRLRRKVAAPKLRSPVPSAIVGALGLDYNQVSYRSYETLLKDRTDVDPRKPPDVTYVDETGAEEPYALGLRPVSPPRRASTLALDVDAPSAAILDAMRRLDPGRATADARALLEELARRGPRRPASEARKTAVREAAASLLGRCLEGLPETAQRREASRLAGDLTSETDASVRAVLAIALRRVGYLVQTMLEKAIAAEVDPAAARRAYEARRGIAHDPPDAELLALTRSKRVLDRKGAYALLEQSPSPLVLEELENRLSEEQDARAKELLAVVVRRLSDELTA